MRALVLAALVACSPTTWTHGVPNLDTVDPNVLRSGQPTDEGWAYINQLAAGRHVIVIKLNFPAEGADTTAERLGFEVIDLAIQPEGDQDLLRDVEGTFVRPDPAKVRNALLVLATARTRPDILYLVHCTHGQDRTGLVVGAHRVLNEGWTRERALAEMQLHHFHESLVGLWRAWEAL